MKQAVNDIENNLIDDIIHNLKKQDDNKIYSKEEIIRWLKLFKK